MLLCQILYIRSDNNDRTWRRPSEPQVLRLIAYYKLCSGVTWYCNQKPPNHIQRSMNTTMAHLLLEFFIWQNNYLLSLSYIGIIWAVQVCHWLSNARSLTWRYNIPETLQTYWGIISHWMIGSSVSPCKTGILRLYTIRYNVGILWFRLMWVIELIKWISYIVMSITKGGNIEMN